MLPEWNNIKNFNYTETCIFCTPDEILSLSTNDGFVHLHKESYFKRNIIMAQIHFTYPDAKYLMSIFQTIEQQGMFGSKCLESLMRL